VDGGSDLDIDTVKLSLGDYVAYSAAYANGEFTLEFPAVDDKYLNTVTQGIPDGVAVSDANVKIDDASLLEFNFCAVPIPVCLPYAVAASVSSALLTEGNGSCCKRRVRNFNAARCSGVLSREGA
jgi:hypothetical protein